MTSTMLTSTSYFDVINLLYAQFLLLHEQYLFPTQSFITVPKIKQTLDTAMKRNCDAKLI